jgi:hypothetical protein
MKDSRGSGSEERGHTALTLGEKAAEGKITCGGYFSKRGVVKPTII